MGSRPRRVLFTGHSNGVVQIWDLSTALDLSARSGEPTVAQIGGPTATELVHALEQCEVVASVASTPAPTPVPTPAFGPSSNKIKASNMPLLYQLQQTNNERVRSDQTEHSESANDDDEN